MVKAIAPNAPSGASFMMMPTMPKKHVRDLSMSATSGRPRSPSANSAKPNRIARNSTCRISPFGESADHGVGDDVQEELDDAMLLGLAA